MVSIVESDPSIEEGHQDPAETTGSGSRDDSLNGSLSAPGFALAVQQPSQLPSPSPSPSLSPSSSPSPLSQGPSQSVVVAGSSVGHAGALSSSPHERKHSGATLEKPFTTDPPTEGSDESGLALASPISKSPCPHELHDIPEESIKKPRKASISKVNGGDPQPATGSERPVEEKERRPRKHSVNHDNGEVLKLTAAEVAELTSAPESLPVASPARMIASAQSSLDPSPVIDRRASLPDSSILDVDSWNKRTRKTSASETTVVEPEAHGDRRVSASETRLNTPPTRRKGHHSRAVSTPPATSKYTTGNQAQQTQPFGKQLPPGMRPDPLDLDQVSSKLQNSRRQPGSGSPSPLPQSMPIPPMSIPTYLQLELSSTRPSPLYIYRSASSEFPYESSKIKFERLLNFLLLPPQLEQTLYFGSMACLDAWLHTFTILPLRFCKAAGVLIQWWGQTTAKEARFIAGFIYHGSGRFWHRQRGRRGSESLEDRSRSASRASRKSASHQSQSGRKAELGAPTSNAERPRIEIERKPRQGWGRRHRRTKSQPSTLSSYNKADLLQGAVIICSCVILMKLDASRMYHSIRGQSAIKLYVIFNALEVRRTSNPSRPLLILQQVCDKLLAALGQDIFECLFSNETLERNADGRSKVQRPMGMFVLALIYNVTHATALFYQVIALNVAVNSYSNALLTLLISNQFVEVKSTVFKRIEKDNLFQLTCADIVERFQLWLMLIIIALRNIVEVGGLSIIGGSDGDLVGESTSTRSSSIFPSSFTILPSWSGEVLTPFLLVIGSEMLVDWIKHAYISKFNNVKPAVYQRYLDVLAKDYYTNVSLKLLCTQNGLTPLQAFVNQNLIKRLGLPVIPLSCLFIRSSMQTYHMFLATHLPAPVPSPATELSVESATTSPATTAALEHFDTIIRKALGRSTFGIPDPLATNSWYLPSADDAIAALTMLVFFLGAFFVLLACKLVLGMLLLQFARNRYRHMKRREHQSYDAEGKRLGVGGVTEVDEDKRRWIYDDDQEGLRKKREKEKAGKEKAEKSQDFGKISRYEMLKRIW